MGATSFYGGAACSQTTADIRVHYPWELSASKGGVTLAGKDYYAESLEGGMFNLVLQGLNPGQEYYCLPFVEGEERTQGEGFYFTTDTLFTGWSCSKTESMLTFTTKLKFGDAVLSGYGLEYYIEGAKEDEHVLVPDTLSCRVKGLATDQTCYCRAYADIDGKGRFYSGWFGGKTSNLNYAFGTVEVLNTGQTTIEVAANVDLGDALVETVGFQYGPSEDDYQTVENTMGTKLTRLEPGSTNYFRCFVRDIASNEYYSAWRSVKTKGGIVVTTVEADAISNTSVTLNATVDCDDETGYGFEWRKYDAPDMVPSSTVQAEKRNDKVAFRLVDLTPSTYYKYRPFYRSAAGTMYYGEWMAFGTADTPVHYAPTVQTLGCEVPDGSADVLLNGYVLAGSESILQQGFEYWPAASSNREEVLAQGTYMSARLDNLRPQTTYKYRAFAKTASGTTYGEELEFTTAATSGIASPETAMFRASLYPNPARYEACLSVEGRYAGTVRYAVCSLDGHLLLSGEHDLSVGNLVALDVQPLPSGIYMVRMACGSDVRVLKLVVE